MHRSTTVTGNYGEVGRHLNKFVSSECEGLPIRNHLMMVVEHSLGAFVPRHEGKFQVAFEFDTDSNQHSFSAVKVEE